MSFWDDLEQRAQPVERVPLSGGVVAEVRGLAAAEFDALVELHPPVGEDAHLRRWDEPTFRPALIAACTFAPDGSQRDADWWAGLAKRPGVGWGELDALYSACLRVNDRTPGDAGGKG